MKPPLRKRLRRAIRYRALLLAMPLFRHAPSALGALLGTLAWFLVPRQRRLAQAHLAIAFPEVPARERDRIGRRSFANLGRAAIESARGDASIVELPAEAESE